MTWGLTEWLLINYLIGVILIAGLQIRAFVRRLTETTGLDDGLICTMDKNQSLIWPKLLNLVIWVVAPVVWPLLLCFLIQEFVKPNTDPEILPLGPEFECRPEYLVRKIDSAEVEKEYLIYDPLDRVPSLPFGHLHSGWMAFLEQVQPEEEIWEFKLAQGQPIGKWNELAKIARSGFARIKAGNVVGEFLYEHD